MNKELRERLERAKKPMNWPTDKARPEAAARELLQFLLTYVAGTDQLTTHPPELISPERHAAIRDTAGASTWGVMWEEGPQDWAVSLSLGAPLAGDDDVLKFDTTRHGCYAEPFYGFDLFFWPVETQDQETAAAEQEPPTADKTKIYKLGEMVDEALNAPPAIQIVEGGINLEPTSGYEYVVTWDECRTHAAIVARVHHLCGKKWATPRMISQFIEAASQHHGIKIYG